MTLSFHDSVEINVEINYINPHLLAYTSTSVVYNSCSTCKMPASTHPDYRGKWENLGLPASHDQGALPFASAIRIFYQLLRKSNFSLYTRWFQLQYGLTHICLNGNQVYPKLRAPTRIRGELQNPCNTCIDTFKPAV